MSEKPTEISDEQLSRAELIKLIRKTVPAQIMKEFTEVQPLTQESVDAWKAMYENSMSEEQLIANGYVPLCPHTRLTWIKKDE